MVDPEFPRWWDGTPQVGVPTYCLALFFPTTELKRKKWDPDGGYFCISYAKQSKAGHFFPEMRN